MNTISSIHSICICGAGTMGSGIAQVCANAGYQTILFDINEKTLQNGGQYIEKNLQTLTEKQKITLVDKQNILNRINYTNNINQCTADVIIEAIVENMAAKTDLFCQLASINNDKTIFATNTSSLSITAIQKEIPNPQRLAGMHFFNPAPLMKLVEVIQGKQTNDTVTQTIYELVKKLGKTPVLCKDAPGFIVNRVARPYYLEALRLLESEATSFETIDTIMEATGFKMGPFKLMDLIGIDINYAVSNIVWNTLHQPDRLKPSGLQKEKVQNGELGKKTGRGFYQY